MFRRKNVVLRETHWSPRPQWYGHDAGPALLSHLGSCLQDQRVAATTAAGSCGDFQRAQLGRLGFSPGLQLPKSEDLVQGVDTSTKVPWKRMENNGRQWKMGFKEILVMTRICCYGLVSAQICRCEQGISNASCCQILNIIRYQR